MVRVELHRGVQHPAEQHVVAVAAVGQAALHLEHFARAGATPAGGGTIVVATEAASVVEAADHTHRSTAHLVLVARREAEAMVERLRGRGRFEHVIERQRGGRQPVGGGGVGQHFGVGRYRIEARRKVAEAVVIAQPVGAAAPVGQEIVVEISIGVEAGAQRAAQQELLGKVFGRNVDQAAGEVAGQIGREILVHHDVVDQRGGKEVHLHRILVGVQTGDIGPVERRFGVAIAQAAHVDVLAAFHGDARHALHRRRRVVVAAQAESLAADGVDRLEAVALQRLHGVVGVAQRPGGDGQHDAVLAGNLDGRFADAYVVQHGHLVGRYRDALDHLIGEAQVRNGQAVRTGGHLQAELPVDVGHGTRPGTVGQGHVGPDHLEARFVFEHFTAYGPGLGTRRNGQQTGDEQ